LGVILFGAMRPFSCFFKNVTANYQWVMFLKRAKKRLPTPWNLTVVEDGLKGLGIASRGAMFKFNELRHGFLENRSFS